MYYKQENKNRDQVRDLIRREFEGSDVMFLQLEFKSGKYHAEFLVRNKSGSFERGQKHFREFTKVFIIESQYNNFSL